MSCRARPRRWPKRHTHCEAKSGSANILFLGVDVAMSSIHYWCHYSSGTTRAPESSHFSNMHVGLALAGAEQKVSMVQLHGSATPFRQYDAQQLTLTVLVLSLTRSKTAPSWLVALAHAASTYKMVSSTWLAVEFQFRPRWRRAVMGLRLIQQVLLAEDVRIRNKTALTNTQNHFSAMMLMPSSNGQKAPFQKTTVNFRQVIFQLGYTWRRWAR